ncbi:MAG: preprotein translocase subunit YajC [Planctomycetaceae bacterium]|jgi:preprotein translocase subunit YajC|nr:preprotein translocase subunit YajC [Planctomycetaceae bacterium]MBT6154251.1 preprotein translocase subunit YajC [Planctomycetaceae bacterium]MBT6485551.1 preprotein translocase subunit YajC [Planctomycetaceae bacterium]MBT6494076.1 preprotein translocase subunit YajC [Planctomycetaceae bacterium]
MLDSIQQFLIFAADEAPKPQPEGLSGPLMWIMPAFLILLLWQFMFNPRRRDEKKRAEMVSALKKNDRIVTIGGITGTVASVSEDGKYVTIKVEDNTRIKMLASSIQTVVGDETSDASGDLAKSS